MAEFDGKVAIVTGGLSGIGHATARLLAARGATVVAAGIAPRHGGAAEPLPSVVECVETDVTDERAVARLVAHAARSHGGLDILVAAAGIQRYGTAADTGANEWNEVLAVNVTGAFHAVKHALPQLRARGAGSVVIVSSVQAFVTQTSVAAYTTSKGALNALARSIAVDEAKNGIRANAVCPASVDTPMLRASARTFSDGSNRGAQALVEAWGGMHPLGRVARPAEVAEAIAFLAGDRASFITGVSLPVDGGLLANAAVALPD
ncbi:SDR family NAD(P)-dependent oxidoreductase [Streptomyces sp. MMS24-I2-30]|uniref:SDR family NAD(P)-dependent oxidoreductase n=1 Tax=Streptomyces sp. MMS24-I2-30 TaxID=3351564 RepID=UPI003896A897